MRTDFGDSLDIKRDLESLGSEWNKGPTWLPEAEGTQDRAGHSQLSLLKDWIH